MPLFIDKVPHLTEDQVFYKTVRAKYSGAPVTYRLRKPEAV